MRFCTNIHFLLPVDKRGLLVVPYITVRMVQLNVKKYGRRLPEQFKDPAQRTKYFNRSASEVRGGYRGVCRNDWTGRTYAV